MAAQRRKIVKLKRRRGINIGVVIFFIMFFYTLAQVYFYLTKEHLSIYEVHKGSAAQDVKMTGFIIRNEEIVYTSSPGYLSYLNKEGDKIFKNAPVYSIDENNDIYNLVMNDEITVSTTANNINQIKSNINYFTSNYSDIDYTSVKRFKDRMDKVASLLLNEKILSNIDKIKDETGLISNFHTVYAQKSGIISYYMDSYENTSINNINLDIFNIENYNRINLKTIEILNSNSPAYKIVVDDNWSIVIPLNEDQHKFLVDKEYISFEFTKNKVKTTQKLDIVNISGVYYAQINMDQYLTLFLEDRFVEINIDDKNDDGLKIPITAVTQKTSYKVPLEYLTHGGNTKEQGLLKEVYDKDTGDLSYDFININICFEDDEFIYIDKEDIDLDAWIYNPNTKDRYKINEVKDFTGVFNVNKGYAVFRVVEPLYEVNDYLIVKNNTKHGLYLYDHIALNAQMLQEDKKIY